MTTMPAGYMNQIGSYNFRFDIITSSKAFRKHLSHIISEDLTRDVTDENLSNLNDEELAKLLTKRYIAVVQKSPSWLKLRSRASGTASSVGKYIKSCCQYPTLDQVKEAWVEKVTHKPFTKTHTMLGHMNWGVGYEDPALIHFAKDHNLGVAQSGTIKVDLKYILALGRTVHKDKWVDLDLTVDGKHLLISPDGIVGKPEYHGQKDIRTDQYKELYGMLEIKCISPFHYMEDDDNYLQWVADMNTRQWRHPGQIPFVYVTQMGLQAISGVHTLKMDGNSTMWFMRWSPIGYSLFTFPFKKLIRFGTLVSALYFSLVQRTHTVEDIDRLYPLTAQEQQVETMMNKAYNDLLESATYKFIEIDDYPEFALYQNITQHFRFIVPEIDPETLQIQMPTAKPSDNKETVNHHDLLDSCLC